MQARRIQTDVSDEASVRAMVERTDALGLVGEHAVGTGAFDRMAQLAGGEETGQGQVRDTGHVRGKVGDEGYH